MDVAAERAKVVAEAKTWLRTPYHHGAKLKGVGVDCAFFVKEVFETAGLEAPIPVAPYSAQWFLHKDEELYLAAVKDRADEIAEKDALPADIVLYRFGRCFAHGAIIIDPGFPSIIHAYKQAGMVTLGEGDQGDLAWVGAASGTKPRERLFFRRKAWR